MLLLQEPDSRYLANGIGRAANDTFGAGTTLRLPGALPARSRRFSLL